LTLQSEVKDTTTESDPLFGDMLKQMEGMSNSGDLQGMLETMMEQLMSKDVLYEPLKDLSDKVFLR
jgi:peroxin-19